MSQTEIPIRIIPSQPKKERQEQLAPSKEEFYSPERFSPKTKEVPPTTPHQAGAPPVAHELYPTGPTIEQQQPSLEDVTTTPAEEFPLPQEFERVPSPPLEEQILPKKPLEEGYRQRLPKSFQIPIEGPETFEEYPRQPTPSTLQEEKKRAVRIPIEEGPLSPAAEQQQARQPIPKAPPILKESVELPLETPTTTTGKGEQLLQQPKKKKKVPTITLNNGRLMPALGISTYNRKMGEVTGNVVDALEEGYRHLDCAWIFHNQGFVGQAINEYLSRVSPLKQKQEFPAEEISKREKEQPALPSQRGIPIDPAESAKRRREKLFVSSKLWNSFHRHVRDNCLDSLKQLQLQYLDLFIIQWPFAFKFIENHPLPIEPSTGLTEGDPEAWMCDTWHDMEALVKEGLVRSLGVSNFNLKQLERLLEFCTIPPSVLQIEMHPCLPQTELREFCARHGIVVVGVAPFGSPERMEKIEERKHPQDPHFPDLFDHNEVRSIAQKLNKKVPQMLLRYPLQHGCGVITKTSRRERMIENKQACFEEEIDIPQDSLDALDFIGKKQPHRYLWFSSARNLKEYPF